MACRLYERRRRGGPSPQIRMDPAARSPRSKGVDEGGAMRRALALAAILGSVGAGVAAADGGGPAPGRSEEHTSELQSQSNLVCRLLLEKKKTIAIFRLPDP